MHYTVIKDAGHLFPDDRHVLSQCNARLRLLYLLTKKKGLNYPSCSYPANGECEKNVHRTPFASNWVELFYKASLRLYPGCQRFFSR